MPLLTVGPCVRLESWQIAIGAEQSFALLSCADIPPARPPWSIFQSEYTSIVRSRLYVLRIPRQPALLIFAESLPNSINNQMNRLRQLFGIVAGYKITV